MKAASLFVRMIAGFIDCLVIVTALFLLFIAIIPGYADPETLTLAKISGTIALFFFSSIFVSVFYFTYLTMGDGKTIGKSLFGLRVVTTSGDKLTFIRSFTRTLCYGLSALPCFAGFYLAFILRRRTFHDLASGTVVIEENT